MPDQASASPAAAVVDLAERNWLPRHQRGDTRAFGELMLAYSSLVMTLLYRYGIESQHRDDLFQDVFLKIHQAAGSYRPTEPLRPWLVSIVLNTVRNHRRGSGRRQHFMQRLENEPGTATDKNTDSESWPQRPPEPDEQAEKLATAEWLEARIAELPERPREVLVLNTIKGLQMKEIAALLGLPENTVKTHLRRARLTLAEGLAARNTTQDPTAATSQASGEIT